jgi:hypothetical protein
LDFLDLKKKQEPSKKKSNRTKQKDDGKERRIEN